MSTELTVRGDDYLMISDPSRVGAILEANLGGERLRPSDLDQIKIPTGGILQWKVDGPEGERFVKDITGVIIHQHNHRTFYQGEFSGGNEKPDCSSNDGVTGYGNPGGDCETCPLSQWGSKGNGQACRLSRRVYIVQPGQLLPQVISLSPTSVAAMRKFLLRLGTTPYWSVVTKFSLRQAQSSNGIKYAVVEPAVVGKLTDEQTGMVAEFRSALVESMAYKPQRDSVDDNEDWS